jgi:quercetin dioxygenase-like cupin family protein
MAYRIVDANEIEARNGVFRGLATPLGVRAFKINQLELPPRGEAPEHDHSDDGQEEVYAVIRGSGSIRIEGEEHELLPGHYVFLSPEHTRQVVAGEEGLAWIGVGCVPGAFKPNN